MQNNRSHYLTLLAALLTSSGLTFSSLAAAKDQSGIGFTKTTKNLPNKCKFDKTFPLELKETDLSVKKIEKGVRCVVGDFDGNGYLDFFVYGKYKKPGGSVAPYPEKYVILFYEKKKIIHSIVLDNTNPKTALTDPVLYPATKRTGAHGEPVSKTDGIIQQGEGGTSTVLLYDRNTKNFKRSNHASENN